MKHRTIWIVALALLGVTVGTPPTFGQEPEWKAPSRAARKKNPLPDDAATVALGKSVFEAQCVSCHGTTGIGDGVAAKDLEKSPGNLMDAKVQAQSDGALFWKITTGRASMTAFGDTLSVEQRWQVVRYVRTLVAGPAMVEPELNAPEALRTSLTKLRLPYDKLRGSLAKGNAQAAIAALPAFAVIVEELKKVDITKLDAKLAKPWEQSVSALADAVLAMRKATKIEDLRASFGGLSEHVEAALARFGHTLPSPVYVFENAPADGSGAQRWIQTTREPENPYLGPKEESIVKLLRGITATRSKADTTGGSK
jgi:mono/diheme cytochrome c family protein